MIKLYPVNSEGYYTLGLMNRFSGHFDAAINAFQTVLSLTPGREAANVLIGEALMYKGEPEAALLAIQQESSDWHLIGLPLATAT